MSFLPGSIPYLRNLAQRKMRADYQRAKTIRDLAVLNFETWPDMTPAEKDVTMRQTQRGISELAEMMMRSMKYELGDLKADE